MNRPGSPPPLPVGTRIALAEDPAAIARCLAVMRELRPHLVDEAEFVARVERQRAEGFHLIYLESDGEVAALAGWRLMEKLTVGRTMYVDDLVTRGDGRSRGFGAALIAWLTERARAAGCVTLELDSGVQRFAAHRFYLRERMDITAHHFALKL